MVPSDHLEVQFEKHPKNIIDSINKRLKGVKRKDYIELVILKG